MTRGPATTVWRQKSCRLFAAGSYAPALSFCARAFCALAFCTLAFLLTGCRRSEENAPQASDSVATHTVVESPVANPSAGRSAGVAIDPSPATSPANESAGSSNDPKSAGATAASPKSAVVPGSDVDLRDRALTAAEAGEVELADQLARQALEKDETDPQNVFVMAYVLAGQNRFREAIRMIDRFIERDDSARLPMLGQAAEWAVFAGLWNDAEDRCLAILEEVPTAVPAHRVLAKLYQRQGRRWEATAHLAQLCRQGNVEEAELLVLLDNFSILSAGPDDHESEPIGWLGFAHYQIADGDWNAAREALEAMPKRKELESALLARIYAHQKDFESLARWSEEVSEAAEITPNYWFALGVLQAHQGEDVAAVKSLGNAVLLDHTDAPAYRQMAECLERLGLQDAAEQASSRANTIEETRRIANSFRSSPQRQLEQIDKLIQILEDLRRPYESLAWQAVALMYAVDQISDSQAEGFLLEINQQRLALLRAGDPIRPREFLLCGVTEQMLDSAGQSD